MFPSSSDIDSVLIWNNFMFFILTIIRLLWLTSADIVKGRCPLMLALVKFPYYNLPCIWRWSARTCPPFFNHDLYFLFSSRDGTYMTQHWYQVPIFIAWLSRNWNDISNSIVCYFYIIMAFTVAAMQLIINACQDK